MIVHFVCRETEKIWAGDVSRKFPFDTQMIARRKLRMIDSAYKLQDLLVPPANRLKKLKGQRKNEYSVRINDQWRICFRWENGKAFKVKIEDYH